MHKVCGQITEVYSRVVGFYRPVKNWNRGKQEEFKDRQVFDLASAQAEILKNYGDEQELKQA